MGKNEKKSAEEPEEEPTPAEIEPNTVEVEDSELVNEPAERDVNSLRKVIKVDSTGEAETENVKPEAEKNEEFDTSDLSLTKEGLEQKRAILQSIKDFDFQIKKNQEEITGINQKLDGLSKDLDDLVSLYEIVSEQMNPFVGLSKVTKKRLDALEAFAKQSGLISEEDGEVEFFREEAETETASEDMQSEYPDKENMLMSSDDVDLDKILEKALGALFADNKIDMMIDEFIENLKG